MLTRTKRRVEITEAGRLFLEEARDIVARADRAAVLARRVGRSDVQRLRVAVGYCMDHTDVSVFVGKFNGRHPGLQVELKTLAVPSQIAAIRDGRLDVGFVRPPIGDHALNSEVLIEEPLVAALPPQHRLASRSRLPLSALAKEPLSCPRAMPSHSSTMRYSRRAARPDSCPTRRMKLIIFR